MGKTRWSVAIYAAFAFILAVPLSPQAETVVVEPDANYPEGPLWYQGRLYFAEMTRDRIVVHKGAERGTFWRREGCGPWCPQ